jgi:hypothetical protein
MLAVGIPLYICASASTPIAAALILKGVSPGAALVFLLAGPATNLASLTVLTGVLGKRATAIYLASIAVFSLLCGLALDQVYAYWGLNAKATIGQASEVLPAWVSWASAFFILLISIKPLWLSIKAKVTRGHGHNHPEDHAEAEGTTSPLVSAEQCTGDSCDCGSPQAPAFPIGKS